MRSASSLALALALAIAGCLAAPPAADMEPEDADPRAITNASAGGNAMEDAAPAPAAPDANGTAPVPAAPLDPGWPPLDAAAIRPGVFIAGGCTANFVFGSPDNRSLFIGTAGHCFDGAAVGDPVSIAHARFAGRLAFAAETADPFLDFALVEIAPADRGVVHPAVLHWGGPTGLARDAAEGAGVVTFGNSSYRDAAEALNPREGVLTHHGPRQSEAYFTATSVFGDSGSPVLAAEGRALGVVTAIVVGNDGTIPCAACNEIMNLEVALADAEAALGHALVLHTWPLLRAGALPAAR